MTQHNNEKSCIPCSTPLSALTAYGAAAIGKSFSRCLRGNSTLPHLSVKKWFVTYPSMAELNTEVAWYRPFVLRLAMGVLEKLKGPRDMSNDAILDHFASGS